MMPPLSKEKYPYTPRFCEENIWWLGKALIEEGFSPESLTVLFLSNEQNQIPLFHQNQSQNNEPLFWDYHVVLLWHAASKSDWVFDFDSQLPFPVTANEYALYTFPDHQVLPRRFHILIRAVPFAAYSQRFHSDRSHMLQSNGSAISPFPTTPAILNDSLDAIALWDYLDFDKTLNDGSYVYPGEIFFSRLSKSFA